jgi:hypothetical protein
MATNVLQRLKDKLWPAGTNNSAAVAPGPSHYSDSELASLKQQRKAANSAAQEELDRRGAVQNPRIARARAAGANI